MKRYIYVVGKTKRHITYGNIFRVRNNDIEFVTEFSFNRWSMRGEISEVFNALMECGEIPKKYYKSSGKTGACGDGYFYGEVTKHYDIKEAFLPVV